MSRVRYGDVDLDAIQAQTKAALGDLDRITRVIKLGGFVNGVPGFTDQPKVINGASDLLVEVLGNKGLHARSAVGAGGLPLNVPVEIDAALAASGDAEALVVGGVVNVLDGQELQAVHLLDLLFEGHAPEQLVDARLDLRG